MSERASILLVDDKRENLVALRAILEAPDLDLVLAHSGNEALAQTLERPFACVLLDVEMPGLNGLEVAKILRDDPTLGTIPILFLTAERYADADMFRAYEFGAVDYLTKPLDAAVVRGKVRVFAELFRRREEVLRLNEALRNSHEELREFARIAAHDLKEPARVVSVYAQLLQRTLGAQGDAPADVVSQLGTICTAGQRLCTLLDALTDFVSEREAEPVVPQRAPAPSGSER